MGSVAREWSVVIPAPVGEARLVLRWAWSVLEGLRCAWLGHLGQALDAEASRLAIQRL